MRVKVIINPAAGRAEPILRVLNDVFGRVGIEWDVAITLPSSKSASMTPVLIRKASRRRDRRARLLG